MFRFLFVLFLFFIFFSCDDADSTYYSLTDENVYVIKSFPEERMLHGKDIGPRGLFADPTDITAGGAGYFIVRDAKSEHFFHILNDKLNVVTSFGQEGEDLHQFSSVPTLPRQDFLSNSAIYAYQFDHTLFKWAFDPHNVEIVSDTVLHLPMPEQLYNVQEVTVVSPTLFVGQGGMEEGKLYFFNPYSDSSQLLITSFTPNVSQYGEVSKEDKMFRFNGKIDYNSKLQRIVCTTSKFNQVEIYDWQGSQLMAIRYGKRLNNFMEERKGAAAIYYLDVAATEGYIYALYLGVEKKDLVGKNLDRINSEIHVFDWEGQAIARFELDRLIGTFVVDEKQNRIIGINTDNEAQRLTAYNLPVEIEK